jgi:two-component system sensor histidine kinase MprB
VSFRARLALATAAAVALAVALSAAVVYIVVRDQLRSQVDSSLRQRAGDIEHIPLNAVDSEHGRFFLSIPRPLLGGPGGYVQLVTSSGKTSRPDEEDVPLPVTDHVLEVARGTSDAFFTDARAADTHVRVLTFPYARGFAVQVTRPLTEVDHSLGRIRTLLLLITAAGVALAAALGLAVARTALAPVRRLTGATENVTKTGDLSERIDAHGQDELSRLASSFNTMLSALEESTRAQQQLVGDASHELRTPLTSLRTNVEVLAGGRELPAGERHRLLTDVVEQLDEMTTLIGELIELARGEREPGQPEEVRLDLVAANALERTRRNRPGIVFETDFEQSLVRGVPESIERAIGNLLDNAAKWSPADGPVEVRVANGEVTVRDHGPGIDEADLPYVFDRFYRASSARGLPGSGLGLAIVRQVAEAHGGEVVAETAEGGGTRMRLRLDGRTS